MAKKTVKTEEQKEIDWKRAFEELSIKYDEVMAKYNHLQERYSRR